MTLSIVYNNSSKLCHYSSRSISPCAQPLGRTRRIEPERFLQSEICQGSTVPEGRCPPGVLALHPERSQGGIVLLDSHHINNALKKSFMKNSNKKKSPQGIIDPRDKRSEVVHFKVNPRENLDIYTTAKKCGMTVSAFVRARALGYEPIARLTQEEKDLITKLAQVRSDNANLANAISGLTGEEKRKLFHNRQLMEKWYSEIKPITDAVSDFIRDIRNMKMLRPRTTDKDGKELIL